MSGPNRRSQARVAPSVGLRENIEDQHSLSPEELLAQKIYADVRQSVIAALLKQANKDGLALPTPISYRLKDAAAVVGVSTRLMERLAADYKIPTFKMGSRRLVSRSALMAYVTEQEGIAKWDPANH